MTKGLKEGEFYSMEEKRERALVKYGNVWKCIGFDTIRACYGHFDSFERAMEHFDKHRSDV